MTVSIRRTISALTVGCLIFAMVASAVPANRVMAADDLPTVQFASEAYSADEATHNGISFTLSASSTNPVTVFYEITGTAENGGVDYTVDTAGVVVIPAGKTVVSLPLTVNDDAVEDEGNETVIVTITGVNETATLGSPFVFTRTIVDNDVPTVQFHTDAGSGLEEDPGYFIVQLSRPSLQPVTVLWDTDLGGTATSEDYTNGAADAVALTIPAGETATTVPFGVVDDTMDEDDEVIEAHLSSPTNATLGAITTYSWTIEDNDNAPVAQFAAAASSGSENTATPVVMVTLSNPSENEVRVTVVPSASSTAQRGSLSDPETDWRLAEAPVIIPAGSTTGTVDLSVVDDALEESDETAVMEITSATNATVGTNTVHTYTILANDAPVPPAPAPSSGGGGSGFIPVNTASEGGSGSSGGTSDVTIASAGTVTISSACPSIKAGDMVKVVGKPAIYAVNKDGKIMYFPSGDEFKSWNQVETYAGLYTPITQDCFDSLPTPTVFPGGVNFRPGSYVVKKAGTSQLYAVLPNNTLAKISLADAQALYGINLKVWAIHEIFWSNYVNRAPDTAGKVHSGMLVRNDGKIWYVDGMNVREVTANGMTANRFKEAFVRTIPPSYLERFGTGTVIDGEVPNISNRTQM